MLFVSRSYQRQQPSMEESLRTKEAFSSEVIFESLLLLMVLLP